MTLKKERCGFSMNKKHFTVSGTRILDPDGNDFLMKGTNVNGPGCFFPRDTLQDVDLITDVWKFNSVRVVMTLGLTWTRDSNPNLDALVDAFTEKGVVAMLEIHDYCGRYPSEEGYWLTETEEKVWVPSLSEFTDYWIETAKKYKDNPYVWFNIMNEPKNDNKSESVEQWIEAHSHVIKAIREEAGAENIIVCDEHGYGQGYGYKDGPLSNDSAIICKGPALNTMYENIVYSLHVYTEWEDGTERFKEYFKDAAERNLCVIVGEYGVMTDDPSTHNAVKALLDVIIPLDIGRMYWGWDDKNLPTTDRHAGYTGASWDIDRKDVNQKPTNLTWVGSLTWEDNRGSLTVPVPDYTIEAKDC